MSLVRFQPISGRQLLNSYWQNAFEPSSFRSQTSTRPAVNIAEGAEGFRIELAAPGLSKEDFEVSISDRNVLTVKAGKKTKSEETSGKVHRREFLFHAFEQSFRLPDAVDTNELKASCQNGILTLDLKKKPKNGHTVKTITVSGS